MNVQSEPEPRLDPPDLEQQDSNTAFRFAQALLDPRGLQSLMLAGGGILVLGLVLWLAVIGVFDNPVYAALGLGAANVSLVFAGVYAAARTNYRMAGRAVAMLGCLLLPLNLWFYDAQGLVTLSEGGHLWLPALVICVIYAVVARVLKDSLFVYAVVAGVTMSGMLFLADSDVGRLWEVVAPSALLVVLGSLSVHAERLFPRTQSREEDAPFTRGDFGKAFYRAGHALVGCGLGLLFLGRMAGRFYDVLFANAGWFTQPEVATEFGMKLAALAVVGLGAYTYVFSRLVVDRNRVYDVLVFLMVAWASLIGMDLLGVTVTVDVVVGALAVVGIGARVAGRLPYFETAGDEQANNARSRDMVATLGAATTNVALVMLLVQMVRGFFFVTPIDYTFGLSYVVSAALVVVACASSLLNQVRGDGEEEQPFRFGYVELALLALMGGVVQLVPPFALLSLPAQFAAMAVVPFGFLVGAYVTPHGPKRGGLVASASNASVALLMMSTMLLLSGATEATLVLSAVLTALYSGLSVVSPRRAPAVVAPMLALVTVVHAIFVFELGVHLPLLVVSLVGFAGVVAGKVWGVENAGWSGRVAVTLAGVAGALLTANRVAADEASLPLLGMLVGQVVVALVAGLLSKVGKGRRGMVLVALLGTVSAAATVSSISQLSMLQRVEVFAVAAGVAVLAAGHVGWRRELTEPEAEAEPKQDDLVDLNLWIGSLFCAVPAAVGLLGVRFFGVGNELWAMAHELGVLLIGLTLLGSGVLCRLRATTLTGVATVAVYLFSLVALVNVPDELQNVAVYLMVGGGLLFGSAITLSVYRDRLLELPERVRQGEGVFAVLKWR